MIRQAFLLLFLLSPVALQDEIMERHVVRSHKNGKPYVVIYTTGEQHQKVKEELFFKNGQRDYVGNFRNGIEHGEWIYYWQNGQVKSYEYYEKGREEGVHYDCDSLGQKTKIYYFRRGTLIREVGG